jgi:hypothetical protein
MRICKRYPRIAAITPVRVRLSLGQAGTYIASIAVVGAKDAVEGNIQDLTSSVYSILLAELLIYLVVVGIVVVVGWL